ncbi:MAG: hypothetical protein HY017_30195 [Betaproteobacteria bacterium]|nr:hypothetical protein [Betaproteobacteria bacterium]
MPRYTSSEGRHLTEEERQLLIENTERLVQQFEAEYQAELARKPALVAVRSTPTQTTPSPPQPAAFVSADARHEAEKHAKQIVRSKYGVDPELPGWRGLVLMEMERLLRENSGNS